jgi:hypothetical protein
MDSRIRGNDDDGFVTKAAKAEQKWYLFHHQNRLKSNDSPPRRLSVDHLK